MLWVFRFESWSLVSPSSYLTDRSRIDGAFEWHCGIINPHINIHLNACSWALHKLKYTHTHTQATDWGGLWGDCYQMRGSSIPPHSVTEKKDCTTCSPYSPHCVCMNAYRCMWKKDISSSRGRGLSLNWIRVKPPISPFGELAAGVCVSYSNSDMFNLTIRKTKDSI